MLKEEANILDKNYKKLNSKFLIEAENTKKWKDTASNLSFTVEKLNEELKSIKQHIRIRNLKKKFTAQETALCFSKVFSRSDKFRNTEKINLKQSDIKSLQKLRNSG